MAHVVCVYEVVIKCHPDIFDAYIGRIKAYVTAMVERPGFQQAQVTQLEPDASKSVTVLVKKLFYFYLFNVNL